MLKSYFSPSAKEGRKKGTDDKMEINFIIEIFLPQIYFMAFHDFCVRAVDRQQLLLPSIDVKAVAVSPHATLKYLINLRKAR